MHGSQVCYVSVPKEEQRSDATWEQQTTCTNEGKATPIAELGLILSSY